MARTTKYSGGEYRKRLLAQRGLQVPGEEPSGGAGLAFRIRFYICIFLFAGYLLLDYSRADLAGVDSGRIQAEIARDFSAQLNLQEAWSKALDSVGVSVEDEAEDAAQTDAAEEAPAEEETSEDASEEAPAIDIPEGTGTGETNAL